jgi:aspartyl-tRNA(Asn)/glutamyl-tRNA(Gln) amidotransferase subunit B
MISYEPVIGLEVHAQLKTRSKLFSGASTRYGAAPNTQASLIDLGFPGVLPVLNQEAVTMAVRFGLATHAHIAHHSVFDRKNYFYPDLPKGYQISQFTYPIVQKGYLDIMLDGQVKRINITRAHLEEDAGKSLHEDFHGYTGIDLNRAGTPLLEIVSEPELRSASEAVAYLKTLHALLRYIDICDGNLQEGSFRCDANVSVRPMGQEAFGTRCEIKNINSFKFVEKAILYEIDRQIRVIESGGVIKQQTRLYDSQKNETRAMRDKEDANDYRYFPDPDLLPVVIDDAFIQGIRSKMPELPEAKKTRFQTDYTLSDYDARILTSTRELANYFEQVVTESRGAEPKLVANWMMGDLMAALNKANLDIAESPVSTAQLGSLLHRLHDNTLSGKMAKEVFEHLWAGEDNADSIIAKQGLQQVTDTGTIEKLVMDVIAANPSQVADYKAGKDKLFGFFVGQIMKLSQGKANPDLVNRLLKEKL